MPCVPIVTIRRIITGIQLDGPTIYGKVPPPPGEWYTLDFARQWFGVTSKTIRNILSERRAEFDPPHYDRMRRVISPRDLETLKSIFEISVNRKVPVPTRPDTSPRKAM